MVKKNNIYNEDCLKTLKKMKDDSVNNKINTYIFKKNVSL